MIKKHYLYPSNESFIKHRILKFADLVTEQNIVILLAYLNGTLPRAMAELFQFHIPQPTRAPYHFHVPFAYTNYRSFSLAFTAPRAWNAVIAVMYNQLEDVPRNKFTLKKHVREYLINKY